MNPHPRQPPDPDRFGRLYGPVQASLLRFAIHLTRDRSAAEDLLHQAAMRAMVRIDGLDHDEAFRAWMSRILYRTFLNNQRAAGPRMADEANLVELPSRGTGPEAAFVSARTAERIANALRHLSADQARAVWLVDAQGFKYREVADIMGIPRGTAATLVARGRRALRGQLRALAHDQGVGQ